MATYKVQRWEIYFEYKVQWSILVFQSQWLTKWAPQIHEFSIDIFSCSETVGGADNRSLPDCKSNPYSNPYFNFLPLELLHKCPVLVDPSHKVRQGGKGSVWDG